MTIGNNGKLKKAGETSKSKSVAVVPVEPAARAGAGEKEANAWNKFGDSSPKSAGSRKPGEAKLIKI